MKTIILEAPGRFVITETEPPGSPGLCEVLVRVHRVGICGTDLHSYKGDQAFLEYPRILGHELAVEIVELGPSEQDHNFRVGDVCTVEPYLNCGHCSACRHGKTNCCRSLKTLGVHTDGGMRELILLPLHKLHKAPSAPLDQLALVEMLCIGAHGVRRAQTDEPFVAGEPVLVIGAGPIGLSAIQFASLAGAQVIGMEMSDKRIEFASRHLGVQDWIDPRQEPLTRLRQLCGGDLPRTVIDATGNARSMSQAYQYVEQGGKLVFLGIVQADVAIPDPELHRRELTVFASRNATRQDFAHVIDSIETGKVNVGPWITQRVDAAQMIEEFPNWLNPEYGVVKAMLEL